MTNPRDIMAVSSTVAIPVDSGRIPPDRDSSALAARIVRAPRFVLQRIIYAVAERWERKATERATRYLRTRKDLSDEFRIELERRFMGQ